MSVPKVLPLWESVALPLANALERAFGCHHGKLSRVFTLEGDTHKTLEGHTYKVGCDCGAWFDYSRRTMSITHRNRLLSALRRLQA